MFLKGGYKRDKWGEIPQDKEGEKYFSINGGKSTSVQKEEKKYVVCANSLYAYVEI